ncbi:MAG: helix-turn-helix transcriptional regulator, partial [Treponema sp.]|nr:helix-turn-helix transcriptional regulator [Treponema sp.]
LSSQELSVLAGISRGMTREEIAKDLSTSINTVKNILKTVYEKLGAYNKADAIRIASGTGLLKNQYHEKKQ